MGHLGLLMTVTKQVYFYVAMSRTVSDQPHMS
jgi:hypothetical protein